MSATPPTGIAAYPAPAKINLFLHVTGRRDDGYHLLQSAFRLIDIADSVSLAPRADGEVVLHTPHSGVPPEKDLVVRAAMALRQATGRALGADIWLDKRIPVGGGLGGGSSDAATTLAVLNRMWSLGLNSAELAGIGLGIGADVPFFLFGGSAWAEGVGEQLTSLDLPPAWYLVLVPPVGVPTAAVFGDKGLTRNTKSAKISSFSARFQPFPDADADTGASETGVGAAKAWLPSPTGTFGHNDLEPVVRGKYPEVARHLDWLASQAGGAEMRVRMSGSGACVFAEFATERQARSVASRMPGEMRGFVAKGLDRHPLGLMGNG